MVIGQKMTIKSEEKIARGQDSLGTSYRNSIGYQKTLEYYQEIVNQGFEWVTNVFSPQQKPTLASRIKKLEEEGKEVFVGDVIFSQDGKKTEWKGRVIFARDRE